MSQTIVVLKRPQEFANGLFFGSATAHSRATTHSGPNQSCVIASSFERYTTRVFSAGSSYAY
jgi:hypothetical protein